MKILERQHIDIEKWDRLVNNTEESSFFSCSWYLDATAENWCVLVNDDYTGGLALPYSIRLGVKTLYTPIFVRYVEWLGKPADGLMINELIRAEFKSIHLATKSPILGVGYETYVYQTIASDTERTLGSQAKRMLKKVAKNEVKVIVNDDYFKVQQVIHAELTDRIKGMDMKHMHALNELFTAAKNNGTLVAYSVADDGGVICLEDATKTLYLKGTVEPTLKKIGGMYLAMDTAITNALSTDKQFDFGGSRVPGVKQFNHHLGGVDHEYYCYKIDKAPFWFKFARRLKNSWKK